MYKWSHEYSQALDEQLLYTMLYLATEKMIHDRVANLLDFPAKCILNTRMD